MYVPMHFKEDSVAVLHEAMGRIGFGTLVTLGAEGFEASHVPMLVDPTPAPRGTLIGHIARGNGQWRATGAGVAALAMFVGPDAYISPGWYATKRETGKVVPTWNYVAVHAHGRVRFFDEAERLLRLVTRLTEAHEGRRARPWAVTDAPADYIAGMLKGIVGFELPIDRLEGKWKLGQNRSAADRAGVAEALRREGDDDAAAMAAMMVEGTT